MSDPTRDPIREASPIYVNCWSCGNANEVPRRHLAGACFNPQHPRENFIALQQQIRATQDAEARAEAAEARVRELEANEKDWIANYEAARRERDTLQAEVDNWRRKETIRGSCCADMERERDEAREQRDAVYRSEAEFQRKWLATEAQLAALQKRLEGLLAALDGVRGDIEDASETDAGWGKVLAALDAEAGEPKPWKPLASGLPRWTESQIEPKPAATLPLRCLVTGNPVGTDTWEVGRPCACRNCASRAAHRAGDGK